MAETGSAAKGMFGTTATQSYSQRSSMRYTATSMSSRKGIRCPAMEQGEGSRTGKESTRLFVGPGQNRMQRWLQRIQLGSPPRSAFVEVEPALDTRDLPIWPGPRDVVLPQDQVTTQIEEEKPGFFWQKGAAVPGLFVASLLAGASSGLRKDAGTSDTVQRRHRTGGSRGPADQDWSSYEKYDAFRHLLRSSPLLKEARYRPLQALLDAAPRSGADKYDFFKALMRGMVNAPPEETQFGLVWDVVKHPTQDPAGFDASALRKYDMVAELLHSLQLHADWGLPDNDPVAWVFENAWHENANSKYDPLIAAFGLSAPTIKSKYDPLPGVLAAEAPQGAGWVDPVGDLLRGTRSLDLTRAGPLGRAKYDPLPDVLAAEAPTARDMIADIIAGLKRHAAMWTFSPSLSGLDGDITSSARRPKISAPSGTSKYDPLPAVLHAQAQPLDPNSDPLVGLLNTQVPSDGKYDPLPSALSTDAPRPGSTFLSGFLKQRTHSDRYDPMRDALAAAPPAAGSSPLSGILKPRGPAADKYDPMAGGASSATTTGRTASSASSGVMRPQGTPAAPSEEGLTGAFGGRTRGMGNANEPGEASPDLLAGVDKANPVEGFKSANGASGAAGPQTVNGKSGDGGKLNPLLRTVDWLQKGPAESKPALATPPAVDSKPAANTGPPVQNAARVLKRSKTHDIRKTFSEWGSKSKTAAKRPARRESEWGSKSDLTATSLNGQPSLTAAASTLPSESIVFPTRFPLFRSGARLQPERLPVRVAEHKNTDRKVPREMAWAAGSAALSRQLSSRQAIVAALNSSRPAVAKASEAATLHFDGLATPFGADESLASSALAQALSRGGW